MSKSLDKLKTIQAHLVKELTGGMKEAELKEGEDMLGIASVEMFDSDGDVIRVDGIDVSKYHQPPKRHIKMLASHMGSLPSGEPPIIGRVERFFNTTTEVNGEEAKALAFAFSFARDEEGELTPLANAYKRLMPKYLDSFSVGIMVDEFKELENGSGFDVTKSSLFEISAVAIPANSEANVIKAIKKVFEEEEVDVPEEEVEEIEVVEEEEDEKTLSNDEEIVEEEDEANTSPNDNEEIKELITTFFSSIETRLDQFEATLAVMSQAKDEQTDSTEENPAEEIEQIKTIKLALDKLKALNTGK